MKNRKTRGQKPGTRVLKKKKHPVKAIFGMAAMFGGDDTSIAPKLSNYLTTFWNNLKSGQNQLYFKKACHPSLTNPKPLLI